MWISKEKYYKLCARVQDLERVVCQLQGETQVVAKPFCGTSGYGYPLRLDFFRGPNNILIKYVLMDLLKKLGYELVDSPEPVEWIRKINKATTGVVK